MNNSNPLAPFSKALEWLPQDCRLHAPSWEQGHAAALAQEVAIHRVHITPAKGRMPWPAGGPTWARERFCRRRTNAGLVAYSTDSRGQIIRGWFTSPTDQAAYAAGGYGMPGPLTCPREAVWLELLAPGLPGFPGHLFIGAERQWPGYSSVAADLCSIWRETSPQCFQLNKHQEPENKMRPTDLKLPADMAERLYVEAERLRCRPSDLGSALITQGLNDLAAVSTTSLVSSCASNFSKDRLTTVIESAGTIRRLDDEYLEFLKEKDSLAQWYD